MWWSLSRIHTSPDVCDIVNSPGIWLCYSLACWLISEEKCVCAAMSEDKTPSDSRQWNHGEQKLTYTKDATTLSHSKYHLEWVKDMITPRKPSQKSAALFGWWPPKEKRIGFFSLCLLLKLRGCSRERQCIVSIPLTALLLCNTQIKGLKCFTFEEKPNHLVTVSIWQCKNTQDLGCLI